MHYDEVRRPPGHKARRNRSGSTRHYWVARADIVRAGFQPASVRLHYYPSAPDGAALMAAACERYQTEMLAWAAGQRSDRLRFDGSVKALVRAYQRDPASPYQQIKWNTLRTYDQVLGVIERAFGDRMLAALRIGDFRRWYDEAKKPRAEGEPERVRKAHGIVTMRRHSKRTRL